MATAPTTVAPEMPSLLSHAAEKLPAENPRRKTTPAGTSVHDRGSGSTAMAARLGMEVPCRRGSKSNAATDHQVCGGRK